MPVKFENFIQIDAWILLTSNEFKNVPEDRNYFSKFGSGAIWDEEVCR